MKRLSLSKYVSTLGYAAINCISGRHAYPVYASFKITRQCRLKCAFCDVWRQKPVAELDTGQVLAVLDNLARSSILVVSFEGGEPFLRTDIFDILADAHGRPFYTELTTSGVGIDFDLVNACLQYLDFLHISIDEGHNNLHLLDRLPALKKRMPGLGVQVVVRSQDMPRLEVKVRAIHRAGAKAVIMPAVCLDGRPNAYPDPAVFRSEVQRLAGIYPGTIVTTSKYLAAINRPHGCDTASIIVDADATLYYPCRTLKIPAANLLARNLMEFLGSPRAAALRAAGRRCTRNCGWYQYFAASSYYRPFCLLSSLSPYFKDLFETARGSDASL